MTRILIIPLINDTEHASAVQAKKFSFKLKIVNKSDAPSVAFKILRLKIMSAEGQDISDDFGNKSFHVGIINPDQEEIIDAGDNGQFMYGIITIEATIQSIPDNPIMFLQKNPFTNTLSEMQPNRWIDFIYVSSSSEDIQNKLSNRLYWLTLATVFLR